MMKLISQEYSRNSITPLFFEIEIIERYFKNPKYDINYTDYRGSINIKSEYLKNDGTEEYELIKDFGLAYHKETDRRAIVCFAGDIVRLSEKAQLLWQSFLIEKQDDYQMNEGFYKNLIKGQWVDNISIYQALLMEIHYINQMSLAMGIPEFFVIEYDYSSNQYKERPLHFHNVLFPTRDNYYNFINTLEKLIISNINYKSFTVDTSIIKKIDPIKEDGYMKGTLMMMEEWLTQNIHGGDIIEDIIKPLKGLRKVRQKPAHELYENEYNEEIWNDQRKLMHSVYSAVRNIRLNFGNHPLSKQVEIDSILFNGTNIVDY